MRLESTVYLIPTWFWVIFLVEICNFVSLSRWYLLYTWKVVFYFQSERTFKVVQTVDCAAFACLSERCLFVVSKQSTHRGSFAAEHRLSHLVNKVGDQEKQNNKEDCGTLKGFHGSLPSIRTRDLESFL